MADTADSAILDILKRIQADGAASRSRLDGIETRLEKLEAHAKKNTADSAAMLVIMRATVRDFNERVTDIEDDIRLIKRRT